MSNKTSKTVKTKSKSTSSKKQTVKKKTSAVKKSAEKTTRTAQKPKRKKNKNLSRLHSEMNKMVLDAVDREVIKRFKIIIDTSEEDLTKVNLTQLLKEPKSVDMSIYDESLQAYIKHYLFMKKREKNIKS